MLLFNSVVFTIPLSPWVVDAHLFSMLAGIMKLIHYSRMDNLFQLGFALCLSLGSRAADAVMLLERIGLTFSDLLLLVG